MTEMTLLEIFVRQLHDELAQAYPCAFALCDGLADERVRVVLRDGTESLFCGPYVLELDPLDPGRRLDISLRYTGEVVESYSDNWVYAFVERSPFFVTPGRVDDGRAWILGSKVPDGDQCDTAYITDAVPAYKNGWWATVFIDIHCRRRLLAVAGPHAYFRMWERGEVDEDEVNQDEGEVDA